MNTETATITSTKNNLREPIRYQVIFYNDDKTTVDFVIQQLQTVFGHSAESAQSLTTKIHDQGSATVAVLSFEIAEQKGLEVTLNARSQGFPLQVRIEPEA
jgi:ATP-dependent Clp protease adaptor protein ClpS